MKNCNFPLVSAVLPVFNGAAFLDETIQSLLQQTLELNEIIVIDDCSADCSATVAQKWVDQNRGRIQLYCQPRTYGAAAARNLGCERAKSDWVLLMDADDLAEPHLLAAESEAVRSYREQWGMLPCLAYSAYQSFASSGEVIPGVYRSQPAGPDEILGYELVRNRIATSGLLLQRATFFRAGGFDVTLKYAEDYDLWLRLAQLGGFAYIDQPLVKIRRHETNTSSNLGKMLEGEKNVLRRYAPEFIRNAIERRKAPPVVNQSDFAAVMYKLECWDEGFEVAKQVCHSDPEYASGFFLVGVYYLKTHQWQKAEQAFYDTLSIQAEHGATLNNLGALLIREGNLETAQKMLTKALALYPNYLDARHNLTLLQSENRVADAALHFTWRELRPILTLY